MSQAVLAGSRVTSLTNYYSRALPYTTTLGKFWYLTVSLQDFEIKEENKCSFNLACHERHHDFHRWNGYLLQRCKFIHLQDGPNTLRDSLL